MIRSLFLLAFLASPAVAADYCGLTADQAAALPQSLAGAWQGVLRGGILVTADGKPHPLPADDAPQKAVFAADGANLVLAEDVIFPAVTLTPDLAPGLTADLTAVPADFALPGESPLDAAELLQPETDAVDLTCDPATLPQFVAEMPLDGDATSAFRVFALTPDLMVMVIRGEGDGQVARAVFDLRRAR